MEPVNIELAWDIIDQMVANDYESKEDAVNELGDLDDLALRIVEVIELRGLNRSDGWTYLLAIVDEELF